MTTGDGGAERIMNLVTGFWAAKTLAVAHEIDLFSRLSGTSGMSVEDVARSHEFHPRPAELLLTACAALGLLERRADGRYANSPMTEEHLVRGKPLYFGGWIDMANRREYPAWMRLHDALVTNRPLTWNPDEQESLFDGEDPLLLETFWQAMYSLAITTSRRMVEALDLSDVRHLLDVGGGGGAYDITLCARYPRLRATVFDLPFVCELTRPMIDRAGMADRIDLAAGDFLAGSAPLPAGHDAVLLSNVLHDWAEPDCLTIIGRCHAALPRGGRIIIAELLVDDTKDGPVNAALMSLNMLVETWGRNYTPAEYAAWLTSTGFTDIDVVRFDGPAANGAITARKA